MSKSRILAFLILALLTTAAVASAQDSAGEVTHARIMVYKRGLSFLENVPAAAARGPMKPPREAELKRDRIKAMRESMHAAAPNLNLGWAVASTNASVVSGGTAITFNGLDIVDQEFVNRFDLEPPDQGICAGSGLILESINLVLAVYTQSGSRVAGPAPSNFFFGVPNDFLSDPRCYFDPGTSRWFLTIEDVNSVDIIPGRSFLLGAVSVDNDPLHGFALFAIDVTDDGMFGTPSHPGCPCAPDFPLLGVNNDGVYLSVNEFGQVLPTANGSQIYALSKAGLESLFGATIIQPGVHLADIRLAEGLAFTVQPATSPTVGGEPNKGTEYFMSSLNFIGASDNRIAVFALTNTSSLNSTSPKVKFQHVILTTKIYEEPFGASQKKGPTPLGTLLGDPEETLNPDDNSMAQVVFSGSYLYSAITSTIFDGSGFVDGILYFVVQPGFTSTGTLKAALNVDNYLTVKGEHLIYPAIGVSDDNQGAMVFTLTGPSYFPSAAFVRFNQSGVQGDVHVAAAGVAPDDGFTGYFGVPSNITLAGRWGDYSAAVADGEHNIVIATQYISGHRVRPILPIGTGLANWSTSISRISITD